MYIFFFDFHPKYIPHFSASQFPVFLLSFFPLFFLSEPPHQETALTREDSHIRGRVLHRKKEIYVLITCTVYNYVHATVKFFRYFDKTILASLKQFQMFSAQMQMISACTLRGIPWNSTLMDTSYVFQKLLRQQ